MSSATEKANACILRMPNEVLRLFAKEVANLDAACSEDYRVAMWTLILSRCLGMEGKAATDGYMLRARPETIKKFLEVPRSLHTFKLPPMTYDGYDWNTTEQDPAYRWSHAKLTDVLIPQRESLRVLKLGWMGYTRDQNTFKASLFSALHTLSLCIAYETPTFEACRNWISPNLHTLILDFHRNDSQCGAVSHFGDKGVDTITNVASWAQTLKSEEKLSLESIGLRMYSDGEEWYSWNSKNEWSSLKKVKKAGFHAFWIGRSGTEHTPEMLESYCKCDPETLNSSGHNSRNPTPKRDSNTSEHSLVIFLSTDWSEVMGGFEVLQYFLIRFLRALLIGFLIGALWQFYEAEIASTCITAEEKLDEDSVSGN
ncbi:hypothetical protein F53441_13362 [Fusarium austroafricanum]|uniref:Uncharacterized protein n=1 Tax=Fusarium austroafricanum TaxID=2364996 RepID=A0A8H4JQW7_9HYPO|nr:hypothetical protein F53441_13362 [Fusarium austroafricanum]